MDLVFRHSHPQLHNHNAASFLTRNELRQFSDYVESKEKSALQVELLARTEEAMILRDKSVDELCSNLALRYLRAISTCLVL
jgi:hypothetical protein